MDKQKLSCIIEALLLASDKALSLEQIENLLHDDDDKVSKQDIKDVILALQADFAGRGMELKEIASGYRFQVRQDYAPWVSRLWEEKPSKYSRALLETLVLMAYRQPITRGEIESIRGVSVSSHIVKTLLEREWVRVIGHRDVPGKPAIYGTTREFLDYFNLKSLDELPPLSDIKDLDKIYPELALGVAAEETKTAEEQVATEQDVPASETTESATDEQQVESVETAEAEQSDESQTGDESVKDQASVGPVETDESPETVSADTGETEKTDDTQASDESITVLTTDETAETNEQSDSEADESSATADLENPSDRAEIG